MTVIAAARGLAPTLNAVELQAARWLARHSVDLLRISLAGGTSGEWTYTLTVTVK